MNTIAIAEQVSAAQASIQNFQGHLNWMRKQMEGLMASVHQLLDHVPAIDRKLEQFDWFSLQISSGLKIISMELKGRLGPVICSCRT